MRLRLRSGLVVLTALVVCASAVAQTTSQVQVVRGETRFQSATAHVQSATAHFQPATRGVTTRLTDTTGGFPVPGLGFDYAHHAAVNRDFAARALIDPATQQQLARMRELRGVTNAGVGVVLPFIGARAAPTSSSGWKASIPKTCRRPAKNRTAWESTAR